jgi:hypothetical protein
MSREAYVKWRESLGISVSGKTTATPEFVWDSAWQAASNKAIESLASWMLMRGFSTGHGESVTDLLTELDGQVRPQPAVPDVPEVVFDMLKAAQGACKLGLKGYANTYIQNAIDLLSAGKED